MKITDVKVMIARPTMAGGERKPQEEYRNRSDWLFVKVETDEGVYGIGEATNWPGGGSLLVGNTLKLVKDALIGEDPRDIERLWHKLYRRFTYLGSRGMVTAAISGIDIALWDIKGKTLGVPYQLLGGKFRDSIVLYGNGWFLDCQEPWEFGEAAAATVAQGFTALKIDPFLPEKGLGFGDGNISAEGEAFGEAIIAAVRQAVGPKVEVLIDAHGNYNVPTAVRLAKRLAPYNLTWFEEPVPPESYRALKQVRQEVNVPICVGERLYTRYDFVPIFEEGLADYVMPDVVWTGGISELRKIAAMAEAYYIPISPHNAMGPIQIVAGAHVMMTVPNFYRLEFSLAALESYNACINPPLDIRSGTLYLSNRPGLGIELNEEYIRTHPVPGWQ